MREPPAPGRCPGRRPEGRDSRGRSLLEARHDDPERGHDRPVGPRIGTATEQAPRLISSMVVRVAVAVHPARAARRSRARLGDRVRRHADQVGQHRVLDVLGRMGEQHLADAGRVQRAAANRSG